MPHEKPTRITEDIQLPRGLLWGIVVFAVLAGGAWADLRNQMAGLSRQMRTVVHGDDLDRYSSEIIMQNQSLHLIVPKAREIMRQQESVPVVLPRVQ